MKKILVGLLAVLMAVSLFACVSQQESSSQSSSDSSSSSPAPVFTSPVITVDPATVEIFAGDEIDLMLGVTVTDEYDAELTATISSDQDFDAAVEGTYVITYTAKNSKGMTGTATRTVTVKKALPRIGLYAQKNNSDAWATNNGLTYWFKQEALYTLTEDKDYTIADDPETTEVDESKSSPILSGIFFNDSDADITINFAGTHGEVAVIDKNGIVVLGIDGANGKYVTAQYPVRVNAPSNSAATNIGKNLVIPSKGYAVVIQNTGTFDEDGRSFICKNIIATYGTQTMIKMEDDSKDYTQFIDQAPVVSGNDIELKVVKNDASFTENLKDRLLAGVTIHDDNGTFEIADDVTIAAADVTVDDNPDFKLDTIGKYNFTLRVKDAMENERTFTRVVTVFFVPTENYLGYAVGTDMNYLTDVNFIVNSDYEAPTGITKNIAIYEKGFTGAYKAGWSVYAIVESTTGLVVEMGDWSKIYNAEFPAGTATGVTAADVASGVVERLTDNQMLVIFGNVGGNPADGSRAYGQAILNAFKGGTALADVRLTINVKVGEDTIIKVQPSEARFNVDGVVTFWQPKIVGFNEAYANPVGRINIYDKTYEGAYVAAYSVYAIIDADGNVKEVGDWSKIYNAENPNGTANANGGDVAKGVVARLLDGELLVIFANDSKNAIGQGRWFGQQIIAAVKGSTFKTLKLELLNMLD